MNSYDWSAFRDQFPALKNRTYLNTAGGGVMARKVADAAHQYYNESVEQGDVFWGQWLVRSEKDRNFVAHFIGARPESVAFLQNASLGLNIVARSFPSESRCLAVRPEFPSCTTPFIRAGHQMSFIETTLDGFVDAEIIESALKEHPVDVFILSSVQFANGFRADLASIGAVCRRFGVSFVVDATQSIGAFDIHLERDLIDALVFSGYKWATAGYGNAVLATGSGWSNSDPPLVGWRSAKRAYDLENDRLDLHKEGIGHEMGHPPFPGIFAMAAALRVLSEPGIHQISERIQALVGYLRSGLEDKGIRMRSNGNPACSSGIVLAEVKDADSVKQQLQEQQIWVTARQGGLRVSIHAYNAAEDVERFLTAL